MSDRFIKNRTMIGKPAMDALLNAKVAVFGIGGVGGYAAEALARSGVGYLYLLDRDVVEKSNINRQIIATDDTLSFAKVEAMKRRIASINPDAEVYAVTDFFLPDNAESLFPKDCTHIIDAMDNVSAKIILAALSKERGIMLFSCMGTGNRLDPSMLRVADIYKTSGDPLAKVMRKELKQIGIKELPVVYSLEKPYSHNGQFDRTPSSMPFVPSAAGMLLASLVVRDIIGVKNHD